MVSDFIWTPLSLCAVIITITAGGGCTGTDSIPPDSTPNSVQRAQVYTAAKLKDMEMTQVARNSVVHSWVLPEDASVKFAVIGDYGLWEPDLVHESFQRLEGKQGQAPTIRSPQVSLQVAEMIHEWDVDLILTTGDNNYFDGTAHEIDRNIGRLYHRYIGNYQGSYSDTAGNSGSPENRFFPTLGNHDWHTAGALPYLEYFTLPGNERYYDFVKGNVHFWALDSDSHEPDSNLQGGVQAEWLKRGLAASNEKYNIVYFHHPPYNSLFNSITHCPDCIAMRWPFESWGADLVIAGHGHHYERVFRNGLNYVTNGLGGHTTRHGFEWVVDDDGKKSSFGSGPPIEGSVGRFVADYGAMRIYATEQVLHVQFVTLGGVVIDNFTLSP